MVLKPDAIPTIFSHRPMLKRRKPPLKRPHPETSTTQDANLGAYCSLDHSYATLSHIPRDNSMSPAGDDGDTGEPGETNNG